MRVAALLGIAAAVLSAAGCSDEGSQASDGSGGVPLEESVTITAAAYDPPRVKVLVGGSVTFTNRDPKGVHVAETLNPVYDAQQESYSFDTFTLTWGEPHTIDFHNPGTYQYYCAYDGRMKGVVEVVTRKPPRDSE